MRKKYDSQIVLHLIGNGTGATLRFCRIQRPGAMRCCGTALQDLAEARQICN